jgi:hypothetical protein
MRRALSIAVGVVAVALVAWVLVRRSGSPRPASPWSRVMTAVSDGNGDGFRLISPSTSRCSTSDISITAIPQLPGRNGNAFPALATVRARRTCQLHQNGEVTPLHPNGKPAAPAVILPLGASSLPVTVSPGHAAQLVIGWFSGVVCTIPPGTPRADLATSFSYNLAGARGQFQLRQAVEACPMEAYLQSDDSLDLALNNESNYQPLTQLTVTAPAIVQAGDRFIAHVTLYYQSTRTAVFDPCPMFWSRLSPQSAPATNSSWTLTCANMAPLELGDVVNFDVPLMAPADIAPQTIDLDIGFGKPPPGPALTTTTKTAPTANTQLTVQGDASPLQPVAYAPVPPPPPPVPLQRMVSPPCAPSDLGAGELAPHNLVPGAGVHNDYFTLTNISRTPCTLYKNALVVLEGHNLTPQPVPSGATSLFAGTVDGELEPGQATQVQFQFLNYCDPADESAAHFSNVVIDLPAGQLVVPRPVDASCGVGTGGAGVNDDRAETGPPGAAPLYESYVPTDPEGDGTVDIKIPPTLPRGVPTTIEVTLRGQADWTSGCPGYIITIGQVQTRHGLPCTVTHILSDIPVTYRIQIDPPPTAPLGPTTIRFELLSGLIPTTTVSATITQG